MNPFLLGFVVGTAIGAASVALGANRSGPALRQEISDRWHGAIEIAKRVRAQREQELWAEWRAGLPPSQQPKLLTAGNQPSTEDQA
jgi:gas vesicle protein